VTGMPRTRGWYAALLDAVALRPGVREGSDEREVCRIRRG
jgi:hypothetical protein